MNDVVNEAKKLAYKAHDGQIDKAGRPYIEHVVRVADMVRFWPDAEAVAWLHDVMEDCPQYKEQVNLNFSDEVYWACFFLNRDNSHTEQLYYDRIRPNRLAFVVKLADIHDNANEERLSALDEKTAERLRRKYKRAKEALGV